MSPRESPVQNDCWKAAICQSWVCAEVRVDMKVLMPMRPRPVEAAVSRKRIVEGSRTGRIARYVMIVCGRSVHCSSKTGGSTAEGKSRFIPSPRNSIWLTSTDGTVQYGWRITGSVKTPASIVITIHPTQSVFSLSPRPSLA